MRTWLARLLIGIVFFFNVQCAVSFWIAPEGFAPAYELVGAVGAVTLRSFAILFLMWNVPYAVALWNPVRNRLSVWESVMMQAIAVFGETLILRQLPAGHEILRGSINRFLAFDGLGLVFLLLAVCLCRFPGNQGR